MKFKFMPIRISEINGPFILLIPYTTWENIYA